MLVKFREFSQVDDSLVLDLVENKARLAEFLVVESILECLAVSVQRLVDSQFLLFALQLIQAFVNVIQNGIDFFDRLGILLHFDERLGFFVFVQRSTGDLLKKL